MEGCSYTRRAPASRSSKDLLANHKASKQAKETGSLVRMCYLQLQPQNASAVRRLEAGKVPPVFIEVEHVKQCCLVCRRIGACQTITGNSSPEKTWSMSNDPVLEQSLQHTWRACLCTDARTWTLFVCTHHAHMCKQHIIPCTHLYSPPARNTRKLSRAAPLYAVSAPRMARHTSLASRQASHTRRPRAATLRHCSLQAAPHFASHDKTRGCRRARPRRVRAAPITPPPPCAGTLGARVLGVWLQASPPQALSLVLLLVLVLLLCLWCCGW